MTSNQLQLSNQICFPVYTTSKLITKTYTSYLSELGITYPQYLVLLVLWEKDEISVNQITEKLFLNTNTLSPLLKRMEKMDLIKRSRSEQDERKVIVELTPKGNQMKNDALSIPGNLLKNLLSKELKLDELLELKDTLNGLIRALSK